jgi:hypothetical protein
LIPHFPTGDNAQTAPSRYRSLLLNCRHHRPVMGVGAAFAQADFPSKTPRIIVPFAPGGASDVLARTFGQKPQEAWGQTLVENSPVRAANRGGGRSRRP